MSSEIDLASVETIKAMVERSLRSDLLATLRQAKISLTLRWSRHADFRPVVLDPAFADELAEKELVVEMVSYRKDVTGVDHTVFISPKGHVRQGPSVDPPDRIDPRGETSTIAIGDGNVVAGPDVKPELLQQVRQFIALNREALLDYWEYRIDTEQLRQRLRPIRLP
jgi:hypothetical protein